MSNDNVSALERALSESEARYIETQNKLNNLQVASNNYSSSAQTPSPMIKPKSSGHFCI